MGSVRIALPAGANITTGPKCTLRSKSGSVTLPVTNPQVQFENLAPNWVQLARPGLVLPPYTVLSPRKLHTLTLNVTLVDTSGTNESIEGLIGDLYRVCNSTSAISVASYGSWIVGGKSGPMTSGGYVCTNLQVEVTTRDVNNNATQGTATIELTEANMSPSPIGAQITTTPTKVNTPPATSSKPAGSPDFPPIHIGEPPDETDAAVSPDAVSPTVRAVTFASSAQSTTSYGPAAAASQLPASSVSSYVVQPGDTIYSISNTLYGTTAYARHVAQANGVVDARALTVGQTWSVV